jgi:hypothetical protein
MREFHGEHARQVSSHAKEDAASVSPGGTHLRIEREDLGRQRQMLAIELPGRVLQRIRKLSGSNRSAHKALEFGTEFAVMLDLGRLDSPALRSGVIIPCLTFDTVLLLSGLQLQSGAPELQVTMVGPVGFGGRCSTVYSG